MTWNSLSSISSICSTYYFYKRIDNCHICKGMNDKRANLTFLAEIRIAVQIKMAKVPVVAAQIGNLIMFALSLGK
jgi:hypothetical protein